MSTYSTCFKYFYGTTKEDSPKLSSDSDTRWVGFQRFPRRFELEGTGYFVVFYLFLYGFSFLDLGLSLPLINYCQQCFIPPSSAPERILKYNKKRMKKLQKCNKDKGNFLLLLLQNQSSNPLLPLIRYVSQQNNFNLLRSLFPHLYKKRI